MDLLRSVQESMIEQIRSLPASKKITASSNWVDYEILKSAMKNKHKTLVRFLLKRGCRVNKTSTDGSILTDTTPLHHAITLGDTELLCDLLTRKASVLVANQYGNTPLHLAFLARSTKMIEILLPFSIDSTKANPANKCGLTHFHIACASNCPIVVQNFLAAGVDVDKPVSFTSSVWAGYTPLHFAVEFQSTPVVSILLAAKANQLAKNADGFTPSELAKRNFNEAAIIDYLLSQNQGDEVNSNSSARPSNFHLACLRDEPKVVKRFLECGASIDEKVSRNSSLCPLYTPLHFAVESKNKEKVQLLLDYGAVVENETGHHMSALHLALYNDVPESGSDILNLMYSEFENKEVDRLDMNALTHLHIGCTRNDVKLVKRLIKRGDDINGQLQYNLRDFSLFTPLHFAVRYRARETVELLLKKGACVNRSDNGLYGTPLHVAIDVAAEPELLEILLSYGARPGARRPVDDKTALHLLIELLCKNTTSSEERRKRIERLEIRASGYVERFCNLGCDINERDDEGNTVLHLAASSSNVESKLVEALLERGANINLENSMDKTAYEIAVPKHQGVLYEHVQRLRAARMQVSRNNTSSCKSQRMLMSDSEKYKASRRWHQYEEEVEMIRRTSLGSHLNLLELMQNESMSPPRYVGSRTSDELRHIVNSRNFEKQYPFYGYLIKQSHRRVLKLTGEEDDFESLTRTNKKRKLSVNESILDY